MNSDPSLNQPIPIKEYLYLCLSILIFIGIWLIQPQNCSPSDPYAYSSRAYDLLNEFTIKSNALTFDYRIGTFAPVALIYSFFGISIYTSNLWPLIATLLIIILIWVIAPSIKSKRIALIICLFTAPLYQWSGTLVPDMMTSLFMFSCSYLLWKRDVLINKKLFFIYPTLAMLLLFCGFLTKLTAYWVIPLWLAYFIFDLIKKEYSVIYKYHAISILTSILLASGYLIFSHYTYGDALSRLIIIQEHPESSLWSWHKVPEIVFIKRITISPIKLFVLEYGFLLFWAFLSRKVLTQKMKFWWNYTFLMIFLYWFGSTNLTMYDPLPLSRRDVISMLPGLILLASEFLVNIDKIFSKTLIQKSIYAITALSIITLFSNFILNWEKVRTPEPIIMDFIQKEISKKPQDNYLIVCTDKRNPSYLPFYFEYQLPQNIKIIYAGELKKSDLQNNTIFIYNNEYLCYFLSSRYQFPDYSKEIKDLGLQPIHSYKSTHLYKIEDPKTILPILP